MQSKSNLRRSFVIVVAVWLFLAIPFGLFSYFYIADKRDYLTARNFRLLGIESSQLSLRIENDVTVLSNLAIKAAECKRKPEAASDCPIQELRKGFLDLRTASNFILVAGPTQTEKEGPVEISLSRRQLKYEYNGPLDGQHVTFTVLASMADFAAGIVRTSRAFPYSDVSGSAVFDDVLIVDNKGHVVFQNATSDQTFVTLGPVRDDTGKDVGVADAFAFPRVLQVDSPGATYKLFVHPLRPPELQGVTTEGASTWTLCGLVRADRFRSQSMAISYTVLLLFLFVFILITTSWPLLKLRSVGPTDRLGVPDAVLGAVSILIISSLLTFFLLDFYAYRRLESWLDEDLKRFAADISGRFDTELGVVLQMLERVASSDPSDKTPFTNILCDGKNCDHPAWLDSSSPYFGLIALIPTEDASINGRSVKSGQQDRKWTIERSATAMIRVSDRAYFREIKEGRGWTRGATRQQFFIEPFLSWNTGEMLAMVSTPADAARKSVITVTAKLISLRDIVVPPGFGYAIIDDASGTVMFHSDIRRTLAENFVEECDRSAELAAMLSARADGWSNAPYGGRGHRLYLKPLVDLPWTLIVFRDKEMVRTENLELLSASLIISFFYGLVFLVPVLVLCLWKPKWIWPGAGTVEDYLRLSAANFALIVLMLTELSFSHYHHVPWLAFFLPPLAMLLNCLKLKRPAEVAPWQRGLFFAALIILPVVMLALMWHDEQVQSLSRRVELVAIVLLLFGVYLYVFPPQRLSTAKAPGRTRKSDGRLQAVWRRPSVAYLLMSVSLVVTLSIVPTMIFFRTAHDTEMEALVKHGQVQLARRMIQRDERIRAEYSGVLMPPGYLEDRLRRDVDIYASSFFGTTLQTSSAEPRSASQHPCAPEGAGVQLDRAFEWIRPLYNDIAVETHELVRDVTGDCSFEWDLGVPVPGVPGNEPGKTPAYPSGALGIRLIKSPTARSLAMASHVPFLKPPDTFWWLLGWALGTPLVLAGVYTLVRFVARRLFLLDQASRPEPGENVTSLGEVISQNTLVLRTPLSGRTSLLDRPDVQHFDIRQIATDGTWAEALTRKAPPGMNVAAIDHLEYCMDDPDCNRQKLRLLEKLLSRQLLVVASAADPMDFVIGATREKTKDQKTGKETKTDQSNMEEGDASQGEERGLSSSACIERWARVWSTFDRRVMTRAALDEGDELKAVLHRAGWSPEIADTLWRECGPTEPLRRIGHEVALAPQTASSEEQIVLTVLDRARAYYRVLWTTCSVEQKHALFDIAQDGFANVKSPVLRQLVDRGLVVLEPNFRLLNESFRRFVLEMDLAKEVEELPKEASPWAVVRGTLVAALILLALLVFLTQPQLLNTSNAFIMAASAGIPALMKLFDMIRGPANG